MAIIPRWQTPISRWSLDGNANDTLGVYNGTAVDMTYSTDAKEKGLSGSFSSSPVGYVNLSGLALSSYENFTVTIWVKCTSSGEMYLIHERVNSPDYRTAIVIRNDSNIRILTYVNSTFYLVDSAVTIDRYVWNHIVVTFSGSATASVSVYLNGKIYNTGSLTRYPSYQAPTFYLGAYGPSTTSKLVGFLDDVRFYDVALTADEVMNLYKSYATPIWQQPLHHWKLDGDATDSAGDKSGTAVNMTYSKYPKITGDYSGYFNGASSSTGLVKLDGLDILNYTNFSISMWVKRQNSGNSPCLFQFATSTSLAYRYQLNILDGTYKLQLACNNNGNWTLQMGNTGLSENVWYHIVVTSAGATTATSKIYLNGVLYLDTSIPRYSQSNNRFTLGALRFSTYDPWTTSEIYKGYMDDVRFYDVALTASDVRELYNSYFTDGALSLMSLLI